MTRKFALLLILTLQRRGTRARREFMNVGGKFEMMNIYIYICTVVPPYTLIQYPRFTAARKNGKIKEINGS
jgi:hypothetical protein